MGSEITRRRWLEIVGGTVVGLAVGAAAGYFLAPKTVKVLTKTITKTKTVTGVVTSTPTAPRKITIASIWPKSGALARMGTVCDQATRVAADVLNAAGGIRSLGGAKIEIISGDAKSDPKVGAEEAERIITNYKPTAITGCYMSAITLEVSAVADRLGVPQVTSSISNKITGRGLTHIFQTSPLATQFGEMQIESLVKLGELYGWKPKKIAIVYENTAYGTDTARGLRETAKKYGLEVVLDLAYPHGITDATDIVAKIKESGAEVVTPVSYLTDAILIVRTMKEMGVNAIIDGGGAGYLLPDFIEGTGEASEGVISVSAWEHYMAVPGWVDGSLEINKLYLKAYPSEPYIMEHAGEAFGDLFVLADAIDRAGSADPEKVRDALTETDLNASDETNPYRFGAVKPSGRVKFNKNGWNETAHPVMMQIQNGRMVCIYPPENKRPDVEPRWPPWKK